MLAIIGLGNPGPEYTGTRHNIGFEVIDLLTESLPGVSKGGTPKWQTKQGCRSLRAAVVPDADEVLLIQPQRYMNRSGEAAGPLLGFFQIEPRSIVVIHDEIDLKPGSLVLKRGGSDGGHGGVEDLIRHLSSGDFIRVRIGVGHPRDSSQIEVPDWVLGKPGPDDRELIREAASRAAQAVKFLISESDGESFSKSVFDAAQQKFNRRLS